MPNLKEVQAMGKKLGISKVVGVKKADLIRKVQEAEGNFPCFQCEGAKDNCDEAGCLWRSECVADEEK